MSEVMNLSAAALVNPKGPAPGEISADELCDFVPMAAVREDGTMMVEERRPYGQVSKGYTAFRTGDVLLAKITPCFENGKIALANTNSKYAFGSTEFHVIRSLRDKLDPKYLLHFLRQSWIRVEGSNKMTGSAGQRRVPRSFLDELEIPLPHTDEQRRIATILDKADAIRRKRRRLWLLTADFVKSAYMHTVGYLNPHYDEWRPFTIEQLAQERKGAIRSGPFGSALRHGEFVEDGIAVLGIDNAVQNKFAWGERRFITEEKYEELRRYRVFPNDVIITIMGTTGRSAVVPDDIPEAITTKHLATITCDTKKVLPEVLSFAIHSDPMITHQIKAQNKGAIMDGLNLGIIKQLVLRRPPMEEQRRFFNIIRKTEAMLANAARPDLSSAELFSALSQRAFRGEL